MEQQFSEGPKIHYLSCRFLNEENLEVPRMSSRRVISFIVCNRISNKLRSHMSFDEKIINIK